MLLIGLGLIGRYCGNRNPKTIENWIHGYGFPAAKLPGGEWCTDPELVRRWLLARHEASLNKRLMRKNARIDELTRPLLERIESDIRRENLKYGVPDNIGIAPGATTAE